MPVILWTICNIVNIGSGNGIMFLSRIGVKQFMHENRCTFLTITVSFPVKCHCDLVMSQMTSLIFANISWGNDLLPIYPYLNQWWFTVNWTLRSKFYLNFNQNTSFFFQEDGIDKSTKCQPFCSGLNMLNCRQTGNLTTCSENLLPLRFEDDFQLQWQPVLKIAQD